MAQAIDLVMSRQSAFICVMKRTDYDAFYREGKYYSWEKAFADGVHIFVFVEEDTLEQHPELGPCITGTWGGLEGGDLKGLAEKLYIHDVGDAVIMCPLSGWERYGLPVSCGVGQKTAWARPTQGIFSEVFGWDSWTCRFHRIPVKKGAKR